MAAGERVRRVRPCVQYGEKMWLTQWRKLHSPVDTNEVVLRSGPCGVVLLRIYIRMTFYLLFSTVQNRLDDLEYWAQFELFCL